MKEKIIEFLQDYLNDGRCEDQYQRDNIPLWIEYLKKDKVYLVREIGTCRHTSYDDTIAIYQNIEDAKGCVGTLKSDFFKQMEMNDLDWSSYNYDIEETEDAVFISCKDDEFLHHEIYIETYTLK